MNKKTISIILLGILILAALPLTQAAGKEIIETNDNGLSNVSLYMSHRKHTVNIGINNEANKTLNYTFILLNLRTTLRYSRLVSRLGRDLPRLLPYCFMASNGTINASTSLEQYFPVKNIRFSPILALLVVGDNSSMISMFNFGYVFLRRVRFTSSSISYTNYSIYE